MIYRYSVKSQVFTAPTTELKYKEWIVSRNKLNMKDLKILTSAVIKSHNTVSHQMKYA